MRPFFSRRFLARNPSFVRCCHVWEIRRLALGPAADRSKLERNGVGPDRPAAGGNRLRPLPNSPRVTKLQGLERKRARRGSRFPNKVMEDALLSSFGPTLGSADRKPALDQGEKVPAEAPLPTRRKTPFVQTYMRPAGRSGHGRPAETMQSDSGNPAGAQVTQTICL